MKYRVLEVTVLTTLAIFALLGSALIVKAVSDAVGRSIDSRYCNTVSLDKYDGQPCPVGSLRGSK